LNEVYRIKDHWGFGRFYGSGAAIMRVAELLGVEDMPAQIEQGRSPAEVLAGATGVAPEDVDALVQEARAKYDPDGKLAAEAEEASERAADEPDPFGDFGDFGGEAHAHDDESGEQITPAEEQCLEDQGFDFEAGGEITEEQFEACFG